MATRITPFEVDPDLDAAFLDAWRERGAGTLHRALRRDVDLRFVAIGDAPPGELGFAAHPGVYEIAHEDGTPDIQGGVVLINAFELPPGADETFLAGWERARAVLAGQRGYLGTWLHRSLGDADFRFVNVARWSSPLMFSRALALPEFQQVATMPFRSHPALYSVVASE